MIWLQIGSKLIRTRELRINADQHDFKINAKDRVVPPTIARYRRIVGHKRRIQTQEVGK